MSLILDGTNGLSDVDGSASTPAIRGTDANTGIFFPAADTAAVSTGGSERMRIDSGGNVQIGTTAANGYNFRALGSIPAQFVSSSTAASISYGAVAIYRQSNAASDGVGVAYQLNNSSNAQTEYGYIGAFITSNSTGAGGLIFATDTARTERMRIDSSGRVFINRTSSINSEQFAIQGPAGDANNWLMTMQSQATTQSVTMIAFYDGSNTFCGQIYIDAGANVTYYATSSDYRLKENVAPMTGALAKVQQLNPVTYNWKKSGKESQGFIAHELQEVIPEAVIGEKDAVDKDGNIMPQMIDTSFLVATPTAAIQEQQQIINDLKLRIETLENK